MAIVFRTDSSTPRLEPNKTPQLLQGFLNIQDILNVKDGQISPTDLDRYDRIEFLAPDVNRDVADYLSKNFGQIAPLDGNPETISVDDLVLRRPQLPNGNNPFVFPPNKGSGQSICPDNPFNPEHLFSS